MEYINDGGSFSSWLCLLAFCVRVQTRWQIAGNSVNIIALPQKHGELLRSGKEFPGMVLAEQWVARRRMLQNWVKTWGVTGVGKMNDAVATEVKVEILEVGRGER